MAQYFLATAASRALQASGSSSLQAAAGVAAVAGYAVGDIIQITGCSQTPANRIWLIVSISGGIMTLTDMGGLSPSFTFTGNPACVVNHIGFKTASLTLDNTVFSQANPEFNLHIRLEQLSAQTGIRFQISDTQDYPVGFLNAYGAIDSLVHGKTFTISRQESQSLKLGNSGNAIQFTCYLEGAYGAPPPVGASLTYSAWIDSGALY